MLSLLLIPGESLCLSARLPSYLPSFLPTCLIMPTRLNKQKTGRKKKELQTYNQ